VARLLHCPYCQAEFPFADWQRAATCPSCDRRLSFFEATGQAAPDVTAPAVRRQAAAETGAAAGQAAGMPGAENAGLGIEDEAALRAARLAAIAQAPAGMLPAMVGMATRATTMDLNSARLAPPQGRTFLGKPLGWTSGWTIVLATWLVVGAALVLARIDMGHLTALSARESAAITAVERGQLETGVTYSHALDLLAARVDPLAKLTGQTNSRARARWFAFDRPWEKRVYVYWEYPGYVPLAWTVGGGEVKPDGDTAKTLKDAVVSAQAAQQQQQKNQEVGPPTYTLPN
jgi:hypothetical protein